MGSEQLDDAAILRRFGFEPDPVMEVYKRDVDRTLLRQNLMRTPEQRWQTLTAATRLAQEMRRAGATADLGGVLDLPALIRAKRAAGRPKDLEALAELEALLAEKERAG
jgi:hypothetical protein